MFVLVGGAHLTVDKVVVTSDRDVALKVLVRCVVAADSWMGLMADEFDSCICDCFCETDSQNKSFGFVNF